MKKSSKKSLALSTEIVRALDPSQLVRASGASIDTGYSYAPCSGLACPSHRIPCPQ